MCQIEHLFAVDEKPHVPAHLVLFVDHAELQAGVLTVEIGEQFGGCRAGGFDLLLFGVRRLNKGAAACPACMGTLLHRWPSPLPQGEGAAGVCRVCSK